MLKKIFLLLVVMLPLSLVAQNDDYYADYHSKKNAQKRARMEWGLSAGAGWWGYDSTVELYDLQGTVGWQAALQSSIIWNKIALQFEVRYARHGVDLKPRGSYPEVNMTSNSVEVPILASFRPGIFRIHFGPVFRVLNNSSYTVPDDVTNPVIPGGTRFDFGGVRPTVGFTVGAGVVLGRHWLFDLRYNGDFSAAEGVFYSNGPEVSIREHAVQLSVGFVF